MTNAEIARHKLAAEKLNSVKNRTFLLIGENIGRISEYDVNAFILSEFKKEGLVLQRGDSAQIAAFGPNTSFVHYFPPKRGSRTIRKNELVLIDLWAKLDEKRAPFADITWMGYTGKNVPGKIGKTFERVIRARDRAINFIKSNLKKKKLPSSKEIDGSARDYLEKLGVGQFFLHGLGHSIGFSRVHGTYFRFSRKMDSRLMVNIPFTIEPGLYFKGKFGMRSEVDGYVTEDYQLVMTSEIQKEIVRI